MSMKYSAGTDAARLQQSGAAGAAAYRLEMRPVRPDERTLYLELAGEFYRSEAVLHPVPTAYLERTFEEICRADTYALCRLFLLEGQAAGYALLSRGWSQEAGGTVLWIEELYLRPAFRGRGVASAFFAVLRHELPAARYRLEVEPENEAAVRLYRRMGFTPLPYDQLVLDCPDAGTQA